MEMMYIKIDILYKYIYIYIYVQPNGYRYWDSFFFLLDRIMYVSKQLDTHSDIESKLNNRNIARKQKEMVRCIKYKFIIIS